MGNKCDVVIVGSGPASIFAALEFSQVPELKVLLLEKGLDIHRRKCPIIGKDISCLPYSPCSLVCRWGGLVPSVVASLPPPLMLAVSLKTMSAETERPN